MPNPNAQPGIPSSLQGLLNAGKKAAAGIAAIVKKGGRKRTLRKRKSIFTRKRK
jgi:hypothetical protein